MITVQFLQRHSPYNVGETAGFRDDFAKQLISLNVAKLVQGENGREKETKEASGNGKTSRPRKRKGYEGPPANKMVARPNEKK